MDLTKQPKLIEINRDNLRVIDLVQSRIDGLNEECVLTYVESLKSGDEFPVIQILQSDLEEDGYFLIDGFHRVQAMDFITRDQNNYRLSAQLLGVGNLSDAIFLGTAANKTNGLQRTNADKRNAVKKLLELDIGKTLSNREIARHCGVSHVFVKKIKESAHLETFPDSENNNSINDSNKDSQEPKYREVKRNGKTYKQDVSNIGKGQKNTTSKKDEVGISESKIKESAHLETFPDSENNNSINDSNIKVSDENKQCNNEDIAQRIQDLLLIIEGILIDTDCVVVIEDDGVNVRVGETLTSFDYSCSNRFFRV